MSTGFYDQIDAFGPGDEEELIPLIQWSHEQGGFELPLKNLPPSLDLPAPFHRAEVVHSGGAEEVWLAQELDLAIVGLRERLEQRSNGTTVVVPAGAGKVGENKVYSRKQVLAVCRQLYDAGYPDLILLTVKSTTSADLGAALRAAQQFRQAAGWAASEKTGRRTSLPRWAFYLPLRAGRTERTTQGGKITALTHGLPEKPAEEDFSALLVPPAVRELLQANLERARQWEQDARFYGGGQTGGDGGGMARVALETEEEPAALVVEDAAPAEMSPAPPARSGRHKGNGDGAPPDYLRMTVPFGTRAHPEYRGQPLGDLLSTPEGRQFVDYLAARYQPKDATQRELVHGARALAAAGLTR